MTDTMKRLDVLVAELRSIASSEVANDTRASPGPRGRTPREPVPGGPLMSALTLAEVNSDRTPRCCAKCARGTRAIPGPCGYDGACPNHCHDKPEGTYR